MQSAKEDSEAMIRALPDDATFEDMQYKLYVLEKIHEGMKAVEEHGGVSHEDAKKRMVKWLQD